MYIPPSRETECLVRSLIAAETPGIDVLGQQDNYRRLLVCHARRNLQLRCAADYFRPNVIGLECEYLARGVYAVHSMEWKDTTVLFRARCLSLGSRKLSASRVNSLSTVGPDLVSF
ncbi:Piso0_004081 [Millerozyma farinosa CBS 7064]|uniref:Piso0_004081 protein n=1 Tax=Pichia sorbitophila (strain ATCC MYA-4447 / BCRC 22081 / CBS 7064 / NBRC 10061 / NRRL Y-12695) TaxID=559304 RepID=G8Y7F6_PICSO|nr:Piso0_004081 [Millerozyma farinosa CBS 7064]CCE84536.1 Piso0_004081 [Millerozyma farinosa CBS 7064]